MNYGPYISVTHITHLYVLLVLIDTFFSTTHVLQIFLNSITINSKNISNVLLYYFRHILLLLLDLHKTLCYTRTYPEHRMGGL